MRTRLISESYSDDFKGLRFPRGAVFRDLQLAEIGGREAPDAKVLRRPQGLTGIVARHQDRRHLDNRIHHRCFDAELAADLETAVAPLLDGIWEDLRSPRDDGTIALPRAGLLDLEPSLRRLVVRRALRDARDLFVLEADEAFGTFLDLTLRGLVVTKQGHADPQALDPGRIRVCEGAHPMPDERSLAAVEALLGFIADLPADMPVLVLISGGASALVEVLRPGVALDDLARANAWLLANGLPISQIGAGWPRAATSPTRSSTMLT